MRSGNKLKIKFVVKPMSAPKKKFINHIEEIRICHTQE